MRHVNRCGDGWVSSVISIESTINKHQLPGQEGKSSFRTYIIDFMVDLIYCYIATLDQFQRMSAVPVALPCLGPTVTKLQQRGPIEFSFEKYI